MDEITQFLVGHGGPVLFAVVFVEQAGVPFPSAPWLLAAGALSAGGKLNLSLAIGATVMASVIADWIWFYIGRRGGNRVLRLFCRLSLAQNACVGRTKNLFVRHGLQVLVAAKFIPGLGAVMPPLAGAIGVSTTRFLLLDGLGSLFYGAFYVMAGFVFHNQLQKAVVVLNQLGFSALLSALVFVTAYIAFKYIRRRRRPILGTDSKTAKRQDPEMPEPTPVQEGFQRDSLPIPTANLGPITFPNVTFALAPAAAQPLHEHGRTQFVRATLHEV
jgi:membrane protein DedA with SNARE-associated domain